MRLIGVVDLVAGCAVHAVAGRREHYRPVEAIAGSPIGPGDALALARAYMDLGIAELYVADLDAILAGVHHDASAGLDAPSDDRRNAKAGRRSHDTLVAGMAALGSGLWLDAGISTVDDARRAIHLGATRVVVGLETLPSYDALREICGAVGGDRVAFSLDLRDGQPVVPSRGIPPGEPAHVVAVRAANAGVGAVIVIDLARVGTGAGLDLELIGRVREATPGVTLVAGGGVRGLEDLVRLANAGCDGALVATALHDGRLGPTGVAAAQRLPPLSPVHRKSQKDVAGHEPE